MPSLPLARILSEPQGIYSPSPSSDNHSHITLNRPVDVTAREAAVEEKIEKGRELVKEKVVQHSMSRTSSRTGSQRDIPMSRTSSGTTPSSPKPEPAKVSAVAANVRPSFSFASAAAGKKDASEEDKKDDVQELAEKVAEVTVTDAWFPVLNERGMDVQKYLLTLRSL